MLHRFYSDVFRGHFYTTSQSEADDIKANDSNWRYEGSGDKTLNVAPLTSDNISALTVSPVYRFWSENYKHHFYTISKDEKELLERTDENWKYEHVAYYAYASQQMDTKPMHRFYSDNYKGHFYTTSEDEKDAIIANDSANWRYEGVAWYVQK